MSKFKVGDRVRTIVGAMTYRHDPLNGTVVEAYTITAVVKLDGLVKPWRYYLRELEHIKGDDIMTKYSATNKTRNISNLYATIRENDCNETLEHLFDLIMTLKPATAMDIIREKSLVSWAEKNPVRIKWLIERGYIEEVQSAYDKWVDGCPSTGLRQDCVAWAKRMPK